MFVKYLWNRFYLPKILQLYKSKFEKNYNTKGEKLKKKL